MPSGIVIALAWVGQRDTKWLIPLMVSSGYQGEEDNHDFWRCRSDMAFSAFYFYALGFFLAFPHKPLVDFSIKIHVLFISL